MHIILLSGGSGKRLWPLSNDIRSKQFLKVLKNDDNEYESMVQRVYRQIKNTGFETTITVATGVAQVDSIRSQLGDNVNIVIEPDRRDTFPAIALSCSYLYHQMHVSLDEVILVLPVDQYANLSYFQTLSSLADIIKNNLAELGLIGVKPTYASAKYGYIMPDKTTLESNYSLVSQFIEKPSEEKAEELIHLGAYWNGGVFGFRLNYIMQMLKNYPFAADFHSLTDHYNSLEKTSFDYKVVEKAQSVAMVPYSGTWKDLGTWNTLTEELSTSSIGHVVMDNSCTNTHVINELSIPIVSLGINNAVIAASPDGILVTDKEKSSYLKPYVEHLGDRPMYEERHWGDYKVLDFIQYPDGMKSLTKRLTIKADKFMDYESHLIRDEIWTIIDGTGDLLLDGHIRNVRRGDVAYITQGQKHSMRATTELQIIEVQIGNELAENDVKCHHWDWDR